MHDPLVAPPDAPAAPADALPEPGPLPALATLFGQCAWFRTLAPEHQALVLAQSRVEQCEAGDVIAFLASARASYITGVAINIDGGVSPVG